MSVTRWFVSGIGNDSNDGTYLLPKATLSAVIALLADQDTIYVDYQNLPSDVITGFTSLASLPRVYIGYGWDGVTNAPFLDPASIAAAIAAAVAAQLAQDAGRVRYTTDGGSTYTQGIAPATKLLTGTTQQGINTSGEQTTVNGSATAGTGSPYPQIIPLP